jgi:hypothetical protein
MAELLIMGELFNDEWVMGVFWTKGELFNNGWTFEILVKFELSVNFWIMGDLLNYG